MKKNSNLQELMGYAGGHRYLTYLSLLLSAVSAILALFPFVFLFRIIQEVIAVAPNYAQATHIVRNGWMAVLFAVLSILVYVCALMSSHLLAFRSSFISFPKMIALCPALPYCSGSRCRHKSYWRNAFSRSSTSRAHFISDPPAL